MQVNIREFQNSLKEQLSEDGNGFFSIGRNYDTQAFRGSFDGENHIIKNIYINQSSNAGLFGVSGGGTVYAANRTKISNLTVEGNIIVGVQRAGGIVAYAAYGLVIENCHSKVNINGKAYGVGGIMGVTQANVNIVNTYNLANIKGTQWVGGLVGIIEAKVNIYNSYQVGDITGSGLVGGVIGRVVSSSTTLRNVYTIGNISCSSSKGGIIGTLDSDSININSNNVYYKKENGLTGIYNQDDSDFQITGYGEEEWDSNDIVQKLNSGRETQEEGIDKSEWKRWKLGENGYPTFE